MMKDMETDTYQNIINIRDSYANVFVALADEVYQNIFDNTIARFMWKVGEIMNESEGPPVYIKISFDDKTKSIIILQEGTTGIIERRAYVRVADKTKGKSDRGSRGQGWKIWLNCTELVFTETIVDEIGVKNYYVNILYVRHSDKKVRVSPWTNNINDVFSALTSDSVDVTPMRTFIASDIHNIGTRVIYYNVDKDIYEPMKNTFFKKVLISKWYPLLIKCPNYHVYIEANSERGSD